MHLRGRLLHTAQGTDSGVVKSKNLIHLYKTLLIRKCAVFGLRVRNFRFEPRLSGRVITRGVVMLTAVIAVARAITATVRREFSWWDQRVVSSQKVGHRTPHSYICT